MVDVWCVCTGDKYDKEKVEALKQQVAKNLSAPHNFLCIDNLNTPDAYNSWWDKLRLFDRATGPSIYFDLDTIITGNLDYLIEYTQYDLAAPANWGQSGHGGIQSSVMCWSGETRRPWNEFNYERESSRLHGDQCFLTELYGDNYVKLPGVYSYKYHCQNVLPGDARVVCFHGKPDYWEVNRDWITEALK